MANRNGNDEDFSQMIGELFEQVTQKEDGEALIPYSKAFKKNIPLGYRRWVSAFLLREYLKKQRGRGPARPTASLNNGVELFVGVGRNRRVFPKDLIHLFINTGKCERDDIGNIKILDSYSFVEVSGESAPLLIDNLDGIDYKSKKLSVGFAKKSKKP